MKPIIWIPSLLIFGLMVSHGHQIEKRRHYAACISGFDTAEQIYTCAFS